jgi:hypothetical protein
LEKDANWSRESEAATEMIADDGYAAGYIGVWSDFTPSLPAAATYRPPASPKPSIASRSACEFSLPRHELFVILMPFCVA